jgi:hypothetical protein
MKNVLLASVALVFVAATTSLAATPNENLATPTAKPIYNGLQMLADNDGDGDSGDDNDSGGNDDGADHDSNDDNGGAAAGNDDHDADDADDADDDNAAKRVKKQKSMMGKKIKSNG